MKKYISRINFKKYFSEGFLIVFSVLFALFINKMFGDYQTRQQAAIANKSIQMELKKNIEILKGWNDRHTGISKRISGLVEGNSDSLKKEILKSDFLNFGLLTNNETLIGDFMTNTAWESAKSTGIISEFDFDLIQRYTRIYALQDLITNKTISKISDLYFDGKSHDMENLNATLIQFQLRFWELTGQEELLLMGYNEILSNPK